MRMSKVELYSSPDGNRGVRQAKAFEGSVLNNDFWWGYVWRAPSSQLVPMCGSVKRADLFFCKEPMLFRGFYLPAAGISVTCVLADI